MVEEEEARKTIVPFGKRFDALYHNYNRGFYVKFRHDCKPMTILHDRIKITRRSGHLGVRGNHLNWERMEA